MGRTGEYSLTGKGNVALMSTDTSPRNRFTQTSEGHLKILRGAGLRAWPRAYVRIRVDVHPHR
jgi:hypothetical protein